MAGSLERKRSKMKIPAGGSSYGCIGGLFNFLDVNQRLHLGKMLTYSKTRIEEKPAERNKSPKVEQDVLASGRQSMDKDEKVAEDAVDNKVGFARNNSGKVLMRSVNSRRRPSDPQLLRTISIHHLEGNDYVDDVDHNCENPTVVDNSHDNGSSINTMLPPKISVTHASQEPSEPHGSLKTIDCVSRTKPNRLPDHLVEKHSLLRQKLNNALSRKRSTDSGELEQDAESKELLEVMVLLNNNRDMLLKILKNPRAFTKFLESQEASSLERVLDRSGSFPVSVLPSEQNDEVSKHKHRPQKSLIYERGKFRARTSTRKPRVDDDSAGTMESIDVGKVSSLKSESGSMNSDMISSSSEPKYQNGKRRGNRAASAHFKVIKKRIKDVVKDNRMESLRISMDGVFDKIPYGSKLSKGSKKEKQDLLKKPATTRYDREASTSKSMKRSHSLHESLDKYSRLLDTISGRKFFRAPEKSKTKKEVSFGSKTTYPPKQTLGRIFSLPDFKSNSMRKDSQFKVLDAERSLNIPMAVDIHDISEPRVVEDTLVHTEDTPEADNDFRAQDYIDSPLHDIDPNDWLTKTSASDWLTKTSAVSYLNLYFPENSPQKKFFAENITPPELSASENSELKPSHTHFEELDTSSYQQSQSDIDAYDQLEDIMADSQIFDSQILQVHTELDDYYNFFGVPVDRQHEARFNYVRDILWKSGFGTNEFLRAWYSPTQPVDPLLFEETECIAVAETARNGPEMFLENQLLFDLINEVLLEIYDTSSSSCPWLSRFDTNTRPMPSGYHVLEEVWAIIGWYLRSQPQLDPTLDHAVARDFAKDYGWMDIQYDCEDVALDLEDLILEDLLDDVVLELGKFSGFKFDLF